MMCHTKRMVPNHTVSLVSQDNYTERIISVCRLADHPSVLLLGTHCTQAPQAPLDCSLLHSSKHHCTPVYCPIDPCNVLSTNLIMCDRQVLCLLQWWLHPGGRQCSRMPLSTISATQRSCTLMLSRGNPTTLWWSTPSEPLVFMSNMA